MLLLLPTLLKEDYNKNNMKRRECTKTVHINMEFDYKELAIKLLERILKSTNKKESQKLFTEADLTSFAEYVLSTERTNHFVNNYSSDDNISLEERLSNVYHSDYTNWLEKRKSNE